MDYWIHWFTVICLNVSLSIYLIAFFRALKKGTPLGKRIFISVGLTAALFAELLVGFNIKVKEVKKDTIIPVDVVIYSKGIPLDTLQIELKDE